MNCGVTDEYCVYSWAEKKTTNEVLRRINCKDRLLNILSRRKRKSIGHMMKSESLEKNFADRDGHRKERRMQTEDTTKQQHQINLWDDDDTSGKKSTRSS